MKLKTDKATHAWDISAEVFPTYGTTLEKWKYFLGYAVLAPSSHNSQPWRFHIRNYQVGLYADRHRACPVVDPDDSPREWLAAGQALARVLLRARVEDVWASFLNQPIEVPYLRMKLRRIVGNKVVPQAVLRLGSSKDVKPTPRREVEEVLT